MARPHLDAPNYRLARRGSRFYVQWWGEGRAHRVSTGAIDRGEAQRFLAQFAAGSLEPVRPPSPTIGNILDGYLAAKDRHVASLDTLKYACAALRRHLGDLQPEHVTREQGRVYTRRRRAEGHMVGPPDARRRKLTSDGTITREIVTLRAATRWAKKEGWTTTEIEIEVPPAAPARERWLTRDEAAALLAGARQPHVKLFVALALFTAARSGALLDLTWQQVDFERRLIHLGRSMGNKSRAVVPIADALLPYLAEARDAATCAAVVEHGGAGVGSIKTGFAAACVRAKLEGVTPHVLRHTAASWMTAAGVPLSAVARFLGDSEKVVERVYAKHAPDYLRDAAAALSGTGGGDN